MPTTLQDRVKNTRPKIIINSQGQKVREYTWENYLNRMCYRKPLTKDIDLNGRTLVVNHTWGVGDLLYSTPAIYGLKKKYPDCKIIYICRNMEMLEGNPYVDEIVHFLDYDRTADIFDDQDKEWYWLDFDTPLKGGFDYKINLRSKPQLNEFMVSLLRKNPDTLSRDEKDFVNQSSYSVIHRYKMVALDMYCRHAFVGPDDMSKEEMTVYYYPKESELIAAKRFLAPLKSRGYKVITLMPHASVLYKDYPHWREVIRLCPKSYYWVVIDSHVKKDESWLSVNIANVAGCFSLREAAALVIESDLNCSSDTGLLYLKAARGGKCVVTYGPHEPEPFLHYFPSAHGMRIERLQKTEGMVGMCSTGCFIDTESCKTKGKHAPCLEELSPRVIADKIVELLEK